MSKLIVLTGLSASGKSTLAQELSVSENAVILSSDEIRQELLNDIKDQSNNSRVFEVMNKRAKNLLNNGRNVIYDATNTSRKRRKHLINHELKMADEKVVYYMNTHYDDCITNDYYRDRHVFSDVILKQCKQMQIPVKNEGWDDVVIFDSLVPIIYNKSFLEENLIKGSTHDGVFNLLSKLIPDFKNIINVSQDSKYHSFSVSRHTYHVYKYIRENTDDLKLIWAALFHDLGKYNCKSFINYKGEDTRYANFYNHENVSSQLAMFWLKKLEYDDQFIKDVSALVQFHMYPLKAGEKKMKEIKQLLGDDLYSALLLLNEADVQAK